MNKPHICDLMNCKYINRRTSNTTFISCYLIYTTVISNNDFNCLIKDNDSKIVEKYCSFFKKNQILYKLLNY